MRDNQIRFAIFKECARIGLKNRPAQANIEKPAAFHSEGEKLVAAEGANGAEARDVS